MALSIGEQINSLERERTRLEGILAGDESWRALSALLARGGPADAEAVALEQKLRRTLAANPYYSARVKIVEAITILRRLNDVPAHGTAGTASGLHPANEVANGMTGVNGSGAAGQTPKASVFSALPLGVPLLGERPQQGDRGREHFQPPAPPPVPASLAPGPGPVTSGAAVPAPSVAAGSHSNDAEAGSAAAEPPDTAAAPPNEALLAALGRIRSITPDLARQLVALGVSSVEEIGHWTAADVGRYATALGIGRRISKENWIEQAAVLSRVRPQPRAPSHEVAGRETPTAMPGNQATSAGALFANDNSLATGGLDATAASSADLLPLEPALAQPVAVAGVAEARETAGDIVDPAPVDAVSPVPATAEGVERPQPAASTEPSAEGPSSDELRDETEPVSPRDWLARRRGARGVPESPPPPTWGAEPPAAEASLPPAIPAPSDSPRLVETRWPSESGSDADPGSSSRAAPQEIVPPLEPDIRSRLREARRAARRDGEADVDVVRTYAVAPSPDPTPPPLQRSLKRRLLGVERPEAPIDASTHAAYRGSVEEASVEIVRPGEAPSDAQKPAEPRLISRFLQALKGKGDR